MRTYVCRQCTFRVFFEDHLCINCGAALAYEPHQDVMLSSVTDADPGAAPLQFCANRNNEARCNWTAAGEGTLCVSCELSEAIPDQQDELGRIAWRRLERAKRHLVYSLLRLQLPVKPRSQPQGLGFAFLHEQPGEPVCTGHKDGLITINVSEADNAERERRREALNEPSRTVLGHLRHEVGHYYWMLLVQEEWLAAVRALFGDETQDYQQALQQHYQRSNDGSWAQQYVSFYAGAHPWEDFAECFAHYLLIIDALETAHHWSVTVADGTTAVRNIRAYQLASSASEFSQLLIQDWLPLSQYLNGACRSLGHRDAYPYVISNAVVSKLALIHEIVARQRAVTGANKPVAAAMRQASGL